MNNFKLSLRDEPSDIYNDINTGKNEGNQSTVISGAVNLPPEFAENDFLELIEKLNVKQRHYLTHVLANLKTNVRFYEFISGGAGTGKSQLITAIFQAVTRFYRSIAGNDDSLRMLLTTPTGKAASNIDGMTLHSAFSLPVSQGAQTIKGISASTRNTLFTLYMNLKLLIIDEISMVGSRVFNNLDIRLRQIFKSDLPFGGISIIAVGDFYQLRPVKDKFVFEGTGEFQSIFGSTLWDLFYHYGLTECMRQKNDLPFAQALNHLATGELTDDDIRLFTSREVSANNQVPDDAIHLFVSNKEVNMYNTNKLIAIQSEEVISIADDTVRGDIT